jgi:cholesterol oxidase
MGRTEWLSEGAEKLAAELGNAKAPHCDIAIVGSGYGGAVAAARFAGAREKEGDRKGELSRVWVLERGREFVAGSFPERFAELPGQVRFAAGGEAPKTRGIREGLFDARVGEHVSALLANGLGGGSLINAGVLVVPKKKVFEADWPAPLRNGIPAKYFRTVIRALGGKPVPGAGPAKLEALRVVAAGIPGAKVRSARITVNFDGKSKVPGVEQNACVQCGDCFSGCNCNAKNSLAMNYLPLAFRRGASIYCGITVLSVRPHGKHWQIDWRFTDEQLAKRFRGTPPPIVAARVILAAGSYGSTGILLRSTEYMGLSCRLGERFSANGDMIAVGTRMPVPVHASADETTAPDQRTIGPTITGYVDRRAGKRVPFMIEELAIPAMLRRPLEEVVKLSQTLHDLAATDWTTHGSESIDPAAIDPLEMDKMAVYATMGDDEAGGRLRLAAGAHADQDDHLVVDWPDVADKAVFKDAIQSLKDAHQPLGSSILPNPLWRLLPDSIGDMLSGGPLGQAVLTVHPLGGCAMADDAGRGVVNHLGQVFKGHTGAAVHANLAVLDGSIVPTALAANPCLTIAALAERAVPLLADEWNLALDPDYIQREVRQQPKIEETPWRVPAPTGFRMAERLGGNLKLPLRSRVGEVELYGEIDIEYDAVPDVEAWLREPKKRLDIAKARLRVTGQVPAADDGQTSIAWEGSTDLQGRLYVLHRYRSWWLQRMLRASAAWLLNRGVRDIVGGAFHAARKTRCRSLPKKFWSAGKKVLRWIIHPWASTKNLLGSVKKYVIWLRNLMQVNSNAGERRYMAYELVVAKPLRAGMNGPMVLAPGDVIYGRKTIAYVPGSGPVWVQDFARWLGLSWKRPSAWDQLTNIDMGLWRHDGGEGQPLGAMQVDLPFFVRQFATQLQVTTQQDQPRALADMLSFFTYLGRVIGRIHVWSLRQPDYPNPYPIYEFSDEAKQKARDACADAKLRWADRTVLRRPGRIKHLRRVNVDLPGAQCKLTRYEPASGRITPKKGRVLLIHGLGAGANTFTLPTIPVNLVQYLADGEEFEPWVVDLRTSIAQPSSEEKDWTFEAVALGITKTPGDEGDILDAVRAVATEGGGKQEIYVVAHCIGAAMFSMAALEGTLDGYIKAVVLSQVGPLLELPPANRFRGFAASYLKDYFNVERFNVTARPNAFNRFVDRLLAMYPYPKDEWAAHHPLLDLVTHEAYCLRAYGIYGRLFEHANLNHATLDRLGDFIGHMRYRTYAQTIFYATMGRLTDNTGANKFVTYEKIRDHFNFPVCLLHGAENRVFDVRGAERSFDLLASIFSPDDVVQAWSSERESRNDYRRYSRGKRLRIVKIDGYGHQDCMIGSRAHEVVYPEIAEFLRQADTASKKAADALAVVRPPRMGPIVGALRVEGRRACVRLVFAPNSSRSMPCYALSFVLRDGKLAKASGQFHELDIPKVGDAPPTQSIEKTIALHPGVGTYTVVVVTVHREQYEPEPLRESGQARPEDPFGEDLDRFFTEAELKFPSTKDAVVMRPRAVKPFLEPVLETCHDIGIDGQPLPTSRRVADPRYSSPISAAVLTSDVLAAAATPAPKQLRFALASCRYAATMLDREAADRTFGRLRDVVERPGPDRAVPQLLLLVGDQIYADATYGIFDPNSETERYDQRYLECWTAPNAREVLRRLPTYPMLDDHELQENYELYRAPGQKDLDDVRAGRRAFEAFQFKLVRPQMRRTPLNGYAYELAPGGFPFFVADTRSSRTRDQNNAGAALIMDRDSLDDLKNWLLDQQQKHQAMPKFVVSPSVVAPWPRETRGSLSYAMRSDAWDGYPESLECLFNCIVDHSIQNVVFLSGDYHCSVFCRIWLGGRGKATVPAYSIASSGLYCPYPFANTRYEDLEAAYDDPYAKRFGMLPNPGDLHVRYQSTRLDLQDSFAVVEVQKEARGWQLSVDFDDGEHFRREGALLS